VVIACEPRPVAERIGHRIAGRPMIQDIVDATLKNARRLTVGVIGGTVLLFGIALLVLPGPAFIVIPIGLAILGIEFAWARRLLRRVRMEISARTRNSRMHKQNGS